MHKIISRLYELPLYYDLILIAVLLIVWSLFSVLYRSNKRWKWFNAIVLATTIAVIASVTLIFRPVENKGVSLIPFTSFVIAQIHSDIYREIMLNVMLFLPIGLTLPFLLNRIIKHPVAITVLFAFLLSLVIEILQYVLMRGYAEIDDMIFNTLGTMIGSSSFLVCPKIEKYIKP